MLEHRELYCPSHFGNTYECVLDNEMKSLLSEAKFWGFNRFSDWFDTIDLYDLYKKGGRLFNMPEAVWDRKFRNFKAASDVGLELGLVVTPNHVFSDQVTVENEAVKNKHIFGQLVCPSKPGVIEMILANYRNIFREFTERGLKLSSISGGPYDYGGCACDKCSPWLRTFGKLFQQIAELAKEFFGEVEANIWGWWWTDDDHKVFTEWADAEAPDYIKGFAFYMHYGEFEYEVRPIPANCREMAFIHIGHSEKTSWDVYGQYGPNIAPGRMEKTVNYLKSRKALGYMAYSEGEHDEINKALLAGLSSGKYSSSQEVLECYAKRYLSDDVKGWSDFLFLFGDFEKIDTNKCRKLFDKLAINSKKNWRLAQLEQRLIMAETYQAVLKENSWNDKKKSAAEMFLAAKEKLFREVWKLGLQRHCLRYESYVPDWYDEFIKLKGQKRKLTIVEEFMNKV